MEHLLESLRRLFEDGGDGNFLIVTHPPYYLQIAGGRGTPTAILEAVSNRFLDDEVQLDPEQERKLAQRGFKLFDRESNWSKEIVIGAESTRQAIAEEITRVFADVYGIPADKVRDADIELVLDERFRLENPALRAALLEGIDILASLADAMVYLPIVPDEQGDGYRLFEDDDGVIMLTEEEAIEAWNEESGEVGHGGSVGGFVEVTNWVGERDLSFNPQGPYTFSLSSSEVGLLLKRFTAN